MIGFILFIVFDVDGIVVVFVVVGIVVVVVVFMVVGTFVRTAK